MTHLRMVRDDAELEALRRHGFGVAYRMLGSVSEAEDVAQEALLRLTRQEGPIDEPAAWITTVATRLSINVLKSARVRRESYVGPWLPEPLVEAGRPRFDADEAERDALLERFLAAAEEGDLEALEELLAKDAVLYADSGGKAMAPQEPLFGAGVIASFLAAVAQAGPRSGEFETRRVRVNGQPGRVLRGPAERPPGDAERLATAKALRSLQSGDVDAKQFAALVKVARDAAAPASGAVPQEHTEVRVWSVLTVDVVDGRIQAVRIIRNPDKLGHL